MRRKSPNPGMEPATFCQRSLKPSQFQRKFDPDQYIYIENGLRIIRVHS